MKTWYVISEDITQKDTMEFCTPFEVGVLFVSIGLLSGRI